MAYLQGYCVVQGDERIRTAVSGLRADPGGSIRTTGLTERGRLPQATVAVVAVDARPNECGDTRDDARPLPVESLAAPRSVSPGRFPSHGSEAA